MRVLPKLSRHKNTAQASELESSVGGSGGADSRVETEEITSKRVPPTVRVALLFAVVAVAGGLVVYIAHSVWNGVSAQVGEGIGIGLLVAGTVGAPLEWLGHRQLTEIARKHLDDFVKQGAEQIFKQFVPAPLFDTFRSVIDRPVLEDLRYEVVFGSAEADDSITYQMTRRYTVRNEKSEDLMFHIKHWYERGLQTEEPSFEGYLAICTLAGDREDVHKVVALTQKSPKNMWRRAELKVTGEETRGFFEYECRIPPEKALSVKITSNTTLPREGVEPVTVAAPAAGLELRIVHPHSWTVEATALHPREDRFVLEDQATIKPGVDVLFEQKWSLNAGLFPGHGIQLRWRPPPRELAIASKGPANGEVKEAPKQVGPDLVSPVRDPAALNASDETS